MRSLVFVYVVALLLSGVGCAKQHPLVLNFDREPVPASIDGKQYSLDNVERVILTACRNKGWSATVVESGKIEASITIRSRHRARIEIRFSPTHYTIQYVDSSGLSYRNGRIHSNYNHWVAKLDAEIKNEFGLKIQRY